ncbi:hypothetical protein BGZ94_000755 [Podila epigama]|nr:hypothetical protein BGZ94_000755 [Podila epigama]
MVTLPSRQSVITLSVITSTTWEKITRLVVNRDQVSLVPSNIHSLCEHQFVPGSYVRAILADDTPVGYLRVNHVQETPLQEHSPNVQKWAKMQCFMIDQACQGLLFGTRALTLLKNELKAQGFHALTVDTKPFATVHNDDSSEHFFIGLDFQWSETEEHQLVCVL